MRVFLASVFAKNIESLLALERKSIILCSSDRNLGKKEVYSRTSLDSVGTLLSKEMFELSLSDEGGEQLEDIYLR